VLVDMARGLGATVTAVERPFRPEPGAYDGHNRSSHHHGHDHG
jgi:urease accessory protein